MMKEKDTLIWDILVILGFISVAILVGLAFSSCNGYRLIEKHEPDSSKDSSRLEQRYLKTYPPKPAVVKEGKTITIKDTAALLALQKSLDSLKALPPKVIKLKDSCGKEANEGYDAGFETGYQLGIYEGKLSCKPSTFRVDTLYQPTPQDVALLNQLQRNFSDSAKKLQDQRGTITSQKEKISNKSKENWIWRIIALSIIGWNVFKPKIKALFSKLPSFK